MEDVDKSDKTVKCKLCPHLRHIPSDFELQLGQATAVIIFLVELSAGLTNSNSDNVAIDIVLNASSKTTTSTAWCAQVEH